MSLSITLGEHLGAKKGHEERFPHDPKCKHQFSLSSGQNTFKCHQKTIIYIIEFLKKTIETHMIQENNMIKKIKTLIQRINNRPKDDFFRNRFCSSQF